MRISYKLCIIIFAFTIFHSCNDAKENIETINALPVQDTLKGKVITSGAEILNMRAVKNVNDNYLVVVDKRDQGIFKVFNLPGLHFLYSWGREGRGPNEFSNISYNSINVDGN